jgi:peptidoglycan hydrolase-like protein with peptidoglycan-binding domain
VSHVSLLCSFIQKTKKKKEETKMKSLHYILLVSLLSAVAISAQTSTSSRSAAQTMLKTKGMYAGVTNGKLDAATRDSIKSFQKENGLTASGALNRATLEKMSIELTEKQKAIAASQSSYASSDKPKRGSSNEDRPARAIFRATKEQIIEAQKLLRSGGMYSGEESGKLDDPTREGLKKYQGANGLKATGTLNQSTLEKMGIALSDKQKAGAP